MTPWVTVAISGRAERHLDSPRAATPPDTPAAAIHRASQIVGNYLIMCAQERVPGDLETHVISLAAGDGSGTLRFSLVADWVQHTYDVTRAYLHAELPQAALNHRVAVGVTCQSA